MKAAPKVLLIDDSADDLRLYRTLLKRNGYEVTSAAGADEAFKKLRQEPPSLVISGLPVSSPDNLRLLRECKTEPKLKGLRFVFLGDAATDKGDEGLALDLGADAFLRKPVAPDELLSRLKQVLSSPAVPARPGGKPQAAFPSTGSSDNFKPGHDMEKRIRALEDELAACRQAEKQLGQKAERFQLLFDSMAHGVLFIDSEARIVAANSAAERITGIPREQLLGMATSSARLRGIHEDGSTLHREDFAMVMALRTGKPVSSPLVGIYNYTDESYHWVTGTAIPLFRPGEDKPYQVYATFDDVTEGHLAFKALQESESRMAALLENTQDAILSVDTDFRLVTANSAARRIFHQLFGTVLMEGADVLSVMPPETAGFWTATGKRIFNGEHILFERGYEYGDGHIDLEYSLSPIVSPSGRVTGATLFARDMTEKNKTARALAQSSRLFKMLFLCNENMVHAASEQELLQNICNTVTEVGGYRVTWAGYPENDAERSVRPAAASGAPVEAIKQAGITWADDERGNGTTGRAIKTGRSQVVQDISTFPSLDHWTEDVVKWDIASALSLPLNYRGNVLGVLNIYSAVKNAFTQDDIALLEELAEDMAYGITALREKQRLNEAEAALRKSEEMFRAASQSTTDIVWDWDIVTGHLEWHGDIDGMLGYPPGGFPRTLAAWEGIIHPDDRERTLQALECHTATGEPYNVEYRVIRRDGALRNWIDRGLALRGSEGKITRSVGACVDITEHRQSEAQARVRRDLAMKLAGKLELETALKYCLDAAMEISGFETGVIYVLDEKTGGFKACCAVGSTPFLKQHYSVLKADSADARLIKKGRPLYVKGSEFTAPFDEQLKQAGFAFDATVPILYNQKVIASMGIFSYTTDNMPQAVRDSLEAIAADIGIVIDRLQSRAALEESEKRYRFITEHTEDNIWMLDKFLRFSFLSPSVTGMLGYSVDEMIQVDITKLLTPASLDKMVRVLEEMGPSLAIPAEDNRGITQELEILHRDGSTVWTEVSITMLFNEKGEFSGLLGVTRDITRRRTAELALLESEEKYRLLVENAREAILIVQDGKIKFINRYAPGIIGYSAEEISSLSFTNFIHPDDREMVFNNYLRRLKGEIFEDVYPFRVVDREGRVGWVEIRAVPIQWEGKPATLNFITNINDRKLAEEALRESEVKYRLLVESANEVIMVAQDGVIKFINSPAVDITGYTMEELTGMPFTDITHPEELPSMLERHQRRLKGEVIPGVFTYRIIKKDGQIAWVDLSAVTIEWEGRSATLNFVMDVTERKQAEIALKQSEDRYRRILEEMDEAYYEIDEKGNYTFFNNTLCRQFGYTREEMTGLNYKAYTRPEDRGKTVEIYSEVFRTGQPHHWFPMVYVRKNGSLIHVEDTLYPLRNEKGDIIGLRGLSRDVTDRRKAQQSLYQRAALLDSAYDSILAYDVQGNIVYANKSAGTMRGYTPDEMLSLNIRQLVPEDGLAELEERQRKLMEQGELSAQAVHLRKDGSSFIVDTQLRLIDFEGSRLTIAVQRDVTARRQMEDRLAESEAKYRSLIETSASGIAVADEAGTLVLVNDRLCEMYGYSREEVMGQPFLDFVHPAERERIGNDFVQAVASNSTLPTLEFRGQRKDGSTIWLYTTPNPLVVDGKLTGFSVILQDITPLKRAEQELKQSEEKYRTVVENMHDVLYRTDSRGDIVLVSPSVTRMMGVDSVDRILGKNLARDFYADPYERDKTLSLLAEKGELIDYEVTLKRPDGRLVDISANIYYYRDESGQPAGVEGVIRDITEKKKAEEQIRQALERVESTLEGALGSIAMMSELRDPYTAGHQRRVTALALAIAEETGLAPERMQPLRVAGLMHDVGKVYVPSEILSKPGRLTDLEMGLARAHAAAGYEVVSAIPFPWPIADMVVQHHERLDGSGYPAGLKGDQISQEARILAVADVVEAMLSHRPYRPSLGLDKALTEITANRGTLYDEKVVDACILLLTEKGFAFPD